MVAERQDLRGGIMDNPRALGGLALENLELKKKLEYYQK